MPRIRTIKPQLAADEKLATVSRDARLTFILLISQADDAGLVPASPRQLLGALYPYDLDVDEQRLMAWVAELVRIGVVRRRATKGGAPVLELTNWKEHQRIDRPSPTALELADLPAEAPTATPSDTPREVLASPSRAARESLANASRAPREPLATGVGVGRGEGRGGGEGETTPPTPPPRAHARPLPNPLPTPLAVEEPPDGWDDPPEPPPPSPEARPLQPWEPPDALTQPLHRTAYTAAVATARAPDALVAELDAIASGLHGPGGQPVPWPVIGQALHELRVAGGGCTPAALRAFVRRVQAEGMPGATAPPPAPRSGFREPARELTWADVITTLDADATREVRLVQ